MANSNHINAEAFIAFLQDRGLRYTKERQAIFEEAAAFKGHFDPEMLYLTILSKGARVSRASVYRTLALMRDAGVIESVENAERIARYESTIGRQHHDHMLCTSCGKVIEFYSEKLESIQDALCQEHGFAGLSHSLEIRGLCRNCASG